MDETDSLTVKILTLYPEVFPGVLNVGAIGKALRAGQLQLQVMNIRDYGDGLRGTVDDTPCGGGAGMVLRADVVAKALDAALHTMPKNPLILCPSPRGKVLQQTDLVKWSKVEKMIFICGRFEGLDERIYQEYQITEVSLGDYVICGGEVASQVILEGLVRLRKNVLGNEASLAEESFCAGLLEHPHYTRPISWRNRQVPEVLLSGHHKKISDWQRQQAEELTQKVRPDLWKTYDSEKDK